MAIVQDTKDSAWALDRPCHDGASSTVDSMARSFLHDLVHHLHDVGALR